MMKSKIIDRTLIGKFLIFYFIVNLKCILILELNMCNKRENVINSSFKMYNAKFKFMKRKRIISL